MIRVFVDTSAILALLVPTDEAHERAVRRFGRCRSIDASLVTTSYVLVETYALIGRRLGREALVAFRESFEPLLDVWWVEQELHERGLDLLLNRTTSLSLVDAVSFGFIHDRHLDEVFAFDRHFEQEGLITDTG